MAALLHRVRFLTGKHFTVREVSALPRLWCRAAPSKKPNHNNTLNLRRRDYSSSSFREPEKDKGDEKKFHSGSYMDVGNGKLNKSSWRTEEEVMTMYKEWCMKHGKLNNNLNLDEKEKRFKSFKDNLKLIDEHNAVKQPYKLRLNQFSDLSNKEFRSIFELKIDLNLLAKRMLSKALKDQGSCDTQEE